ncbi:MAG: hypothetical protein RLZ62_1796 [Bacteroidota bacterium]|jgi:arabinogalactan endo-1,4-beta-galactosidase
MKYSLAVLVGTTCLISLKLTAQNIPLLGADLSYVNEMEDCGVVYRENGTAKDVFQIFADNGCNLARFRLWHTPSWYDTLNSGKRYSDYNDVKKSIQRARAAQMKVLLDFHLSDFWADPSRQLCPAAWWNVVDNLPVLEDSLYHYVYSTLLNLNVAGALPEMVQIGNETNKGIMLSPAADAAGWSLNWYRNSRLFRMAIRAVRDVETVTGKSVRVALHIAGPADADWLLQGFEDSGVTDFDIIGLSYYWAWHQPTSIEDAGNIVAQLKARYPGKEVMIFETGYIWTNQSNDNAANIISSVHPDYAPASPENQRRWLTDMTMEVLNNGASGVIYWEPAWVSSPCFTSWGQGSHQEHATFFDFQNNLIGNGGVKMYDYQYTLTESTPASVGVDLQVVADYTASRLQVKFPLLENGADVSVHILSASGKTIRTIPVQPGARETTIPFSDMNKGVYYAALYNGSQFIGVRGFLF